MESKVTIRDMIYILVLVVGIVSSYFTGQINSAKEARQIARDEVTSALGSQLPVIAFRLGKIEESVDALTVRMTQHMEADNKRSSR